MQCIRLDYYSLKLQTAQQLLLLRRSLRLEGGSLAGLVGVVSLLGQGDTKRPGIDRELGDKPVTAVLRLHRRGSGLAVAHQLDQSLCIAWDLADHPDLQHLPKLLKVGLVVPVRLPLRGIGKERWNPTAKD